MAAYSIGFDTARGSWRKLADATIGTDAPGGTIAVQIRVADLSSENFSKREVENAVKRLIDLMRETQGPTF